jgi:hypothetical protein
MIKEGAPHPLVSIRPLILVLPTSTMMSFKKEFPESDREMRNLKGLIKVF